MRANPGGNIQPSEVIGRDELIEGLWKILERQSLILSAERRMGKTSVIKKMCAEVPSNKLPIYHELESVRSPLEFVEAVLQDIDEYLSRFQKTAKQARECLKALGGIELGAAGASFKLPPLVAPHWKTLLTNTIRDLVENQDRQVILFWDEVPYMLENMDDAEAMEMLDTLRSLRHMYPAVRMVYTGSIGLHHVIGSLKKAGYNGEPINDMYPKDVPPLSPTEATYLALELLIGERILANSQDNANEIAQAVAQAVNNIPFYIHHLIYKLKLQEKTEGTVDRATINETITNSLSAPLDPWSMDHYRNRINQYYENQQHTYALNLLDSLASVDQSLAFNDLFDCLPPETHDKEMARTVLSLLQKDYYLTRQADHTYCFRYPLIKRYWKLSRDL